MLKLHTTLNKNSELLSKYKYIIAHVLPGWLQVLLCNTKKTQISCF